MDLPLLNAPKPNDKVCQALAKILADAKRGAVQLVGVIAVYEDGRPRVLFGGEDELTPSLNLGVDMLKMTIMQQIVAPPTIRRASETSPAPAVQ